MIRAANRLNPSKPSRMAAIMIKINNPNDNSNMAHTSIIRLPYSEKFCLARNRYLFAIYLAKRASWSFSYF